MGTSKKGEASSAEGTKSATPENLAAEEMNDQKAEAVRGGKANQSDLPVVKVIDKASPKLF